MSSDAVIEVTALGVLICSTSPACGCWKLSSPHLLPAPDSVRRDLLVPGRGRSFCEWKGIASYWDLVVGEQRWRGHLEL